MHQAVKVCVEGSRGCGYRKEGGLYLVGGGPAAPCCKLPRLLCTCPTCGTGIKPARGWTWFDPVPLFGPIVCDGKVDENGNCPLADPADLGKVGLVWIGEKFYPTPYEFIKEAKALGISRRIAAIPREFRVGVTWVLLAHRRTVFTDVRDETGRPGIFACWRPSRIEKVVSKDVDDAEVDALVKRGITPVVVLRNDETPPLFKEPDNELSPVVDPHP